MKLNIKSFALSMGIVCGFILFVGTWWLIAQHKYQGEEVFLGSIYPLYSVSPGGSLLGLLYGFIDGLILGALFAWLYNLFEGNKRNG